MSAGARGPGRLSAAVGGGGARPQQGEGRGQSPRLQPRGPVPASDMQTDPFTPPPRVSVSSVLEGVWVQGCEGPRPACPSDPVALLSRPVHSGPGPLLRERHALLQLLLEGHGRPAQESPQQRPVSAGPGGCWLPDPGSGVLWAELPFVGQGPTSLSSGPSSTLQARSPGVEEVFPGRSGGRLVGVPRRQAVSRVARPAGEQSWHPVPAPLLLEELV